MGFNLKLMFEELIEILQSESDQPRKIEELTNAILNAKKYAEECGHLR